MLSCLISHLVRLSIIGCSLLSGSAQEADFSIALKRSEAPPGFSFRLLSSSVPDDLLLLGSDDLLVWRAALLLNRRDLPVAPAIQSEFLNGSRRFFRGVAGSNMIEVARLAWTKLGLTNYTYRFARDCFCESRLAGTVTVTGNKVIKVENIERGFGLGEPPLPDEIPLDSWPLIDDFFETWRVWKGRELSGELTAVQVLFHSLGFVRTVSIDPSEALDDETVISVSEFAPSR